MDFLEGLLNILAIIAHVLYELYDLASTYWPITLALLAAIYFFVESRWRRRKAKQKNRKDRKDEDVIVADVLEGSTRAFVSKKKLEEADVDKALRRACDRVPANIAAIGRGYKVSLVYSDDNFCALWVNPSWDVGSDRCTVKIVELRAETTSMRNVLLIKVHELWDYIEQELRKLNPSLSIESFKIYLTASGPNLVDNALKVMVDKFSAMAPNAVEVSLISLPKEEMEKLKYSTPWKQDFA